MVVMAGDGKSPEPEFSRCLNVRQAEALGELDRVEIGDVEREEGVEVGGEEGGEAGGEEGGVGSSELAGLALLVRV